MSESEPEPTTDDLTAVRYWEQRYGESDQIWSGRPNQALVEAAAGLRVGRALDLGCGEGGDSIWLAERGWQVSAVDISPTAIGRARAAAAAGGIAAGRITWTRADLASWRPDGEYELVSACFLHSKVDFPRAQVLRRAAGAVVPAGHLLVVGHAAEPPWAREHAAAEHGVAEHDPATHAAASGGQEHQAHRFVTAEQEFEALGLDESSWTLVVCETRTREAIGPDGKAATLEDSVVVVRRLL